MSKTNGKSTVLRILPFAIVIVVVLAVVVGASAAWEYTNQTSFCGLACHTMPPEYVTHQLSAHARVTCEDCHLGRAPIGTAIIRKAQYGYQTGTAMLFNTFKYPIVAKNMRPAREACETCHFPEQFSSDSMVELKNYADDKANTLNTTNLILKTGGGTKREGLGQGIHWHIENPVYFVALDKERQNIPYVRVDNPDGTKTIYVDTESGFDPATVKDSDLQQMDCITCHNRTSHGISQPEESVDRLLAQGLVSTKIPEIHLKAVEVLKTTYTSYAEAQSGIQGLENYYKQYYSDFYAANQPLITQAIDAIWTDYQQSVFLDQKMDANTHPDNAQHKDSAGCFRCHDGKHLATDNQVIRLECNLCHSIPVVTGPNKLVTNIEISKGPEPDSHLNTAWILLHNERIDSTCAACHTTDDPGGVSNTSFCSNSACHGSKWDYAGFDAPKLRAILANVLKPAPTPTLQPTPVQTATPVAGGNDTPTATPGSGSQSGALTFASISPMFQKCLSCHGEGGMKGVNLSSYATLMAGGDSGALVVPGDPDNSLIVKVQSESKPHSGQLTSQELQTLIDWIKAGALEK